LEALDRALGELNRAREREAAGIVEEMLERSRSIDASLDRIEQLRDNLMPILADRFNQRLAELLKTVAVDPQRVLQEAALLADRSDVSEEIQRLRAHSAQLRGLITSPGEAGKRLDFLLQEMNREANTMLSKTTDVPEVGLEITRLAIEMKAEIEKLREQAQNIE
jgi:uncharacterized protein (TIGR00255 family)